MRRAAKRDACEADIVKALETVGCRVWRLNQDGIPDLLVVRAGILHLLECKDEFRGKLTAAQQRNLERGLPFQIVTHPFEALYAVGLTEGARRK